MPEALVKPVRHILDGYLRPVAEVDHTHTLVLPAYPVPHTYLHGMIEKSFSITRSRHFSLKTFLGFSGFSASVVPQ